jgi:F0F1-type ATP synthase assembly protein I
VIKNLLLLLLSLCLVSIGLAFFLVPEYFLAVSTGIGVVFIANAYFIIRVYRYSGEGRAAEIVASFMFGSMGKLSLALGLFAFIFAGFVGSGMFQQADQAFALMLSFFCVYLAYIVLVALWLTLR